jgi:hypothetical protein
VAAADTSIRPIPIILNIRITRTTQVRPKAIMASATESIRNRPEIRPSTMDLGLVPETRAIGAAAIPKAPDRKKELRSQIPQSLEERLRFCLAC